MILRLLTLISAAAALLAGDMPILRVCADPNNLPYSNDNQEGFENRVASLIASDLGAKIHYVWTAQHSAFAKNSLSLTTCDISMGVPSTRDTALLTRPYYHSTYVFVSRSDQHLNLASLSDPRFASWRVGVNSNNEGYTPPGTFLERRGLGANLTGFTMAGGFEDPDPAFRVMQAVESGAIDVAIVWGPLATYFAQQTPAVPLDIARVSPAEFDGVPFSYGISIAVMNRNSDLRDQVDAAIARNCDAIQSLLADFGVPITEESCAATAVVASRR